MGRRPNPLVLEYFVRGAKLGDNSNRYAHTCRNCGENFPKGRMESLIPHLTRKCPSLTAAEKTKIVLRLHDLHIPNLHEATGDGNEIVAALDGPKTGNDGIPQATTSNNLSSSSNHVQLPFSSAKQQNFIGLNVLAEASRQVGGNGQNAGSYTTSEDASSQQTPLDPHLDVDFTHNFLSTSDDGLGPRTTGFPTSTAPNMPPMHPFMPTVQAVTHDDFIELPLVNDLPVSTHPADLSNIAASANETLENVMMDSDLDLHNADSPSTLLDGLPENIFQQHSAAFGWPGDGRSLSLDVSPLNTQTSRLDPVQHHEVRHASNLRPLAINPASRPAQVTGELGDGSKTQKPKARGRFTADRRKEVREVRKLGACMRCRMLKKVCSQGTPCATCASVENARIWPSCVRTKLTEEFPLFFVGVNSAAAFHDDNSARAYIDFAEFDGKIEAYHIAGGDSIWLKGLQGQSFNDQGLVIDALELETPAHDVFILDKDWETMAAKVDRYIHSVRPAFIEMESSPVVQAALKALTTMSSAKLGDKKDELNMRVCSLWTATNIIIDAHEQLKFTVDINPIPGLENPTKLPFDSQGHYVLDHISSPFSHRLIRGQLSAAFEKRASVLCKSTMNEFERRLLQRPQNSSFEIFLIAFVLLNAAERMTWLFHTWTVPDQRGKWPLDKGPIQYAEMGKKFAEITHMMLSLRQLDPKVMYHPESGEVVPRQDDPVLGDWLDGIPVRDFIAQSKLAEFDPNDCRSLDGSFCARLVRPEVEAANF